MPQTKPAEPAWLPKAEAAAYLGVSARSLERHETKGFIEKRTRRAGPLERTNAVEYSVADLDALKAGAPNVHARPEPENGGDDKFDITSEPTRDVATRAATKTPSLALAKRENGGGGDLAVLITAIASLSNEIGSKRQDECYSSGFNDGVAAAPKPWLTLAEAVEYSGLPAPWLVAQARGGGVRAVNVGNGAREFWRFNRDGLSK